MKIELTVALAAPHFVGDPQAASNCLKLLDGIPLVPITDAVPELADGMMDCWFARPPSSLEVCTMTKNSILDELRRTRERLLAEAGGTIEGLVAAIRGRFARRTRKRKGRK